MSETPATPPTDHGDPHDHTDPARVAEMGGALLVRLSAMLRTARTYDAANQAFQRQLQDCHALIVQMLEDEDDIALVAVTDYFYINGVRIRATASLLSVYHSLMSEFERRSLGGVRFVNGVSPAELERFSSDGRWSKPASIISAMSMRATWGSRVEES